MSVLEGRSRNRWLAALAAVLLVAGAVAVWRADADAPNGKGAMAQAAKPKGILMEGMDSTLSSDPTRVLIAVDPKVDRDRPLLRLALSPTVVKPQEAFLVAVYATGGPSDPVEIGSFSFFPPPQVGETRIFPVAVAPALRRQQTGPVELSIRLLPLDGHEVHSRVKIFGADLASDWP